MSGEVGVGWGERPGMVTACIVQGPGATRKVGSLVLRPCNTCRGVSVHSGALAAYDPALRGVLALSSRCCALCLLRVSFASLKRRVDPMTFLPGGMPFWPLGFGGCRTS